MRDMILINNLHISLSRDCFVTEKHITKNKEQIITESIVDKMESE